MMDTAPLWGFFDRPHLPFSKGGALCS